MHRSVFFFQCLTIVLFLFGLLAPVPVQAFASPIIQPEHTTSSPELPTFFTKAEKKGIPITQAASDRASDIYVTFARPFDFEALRQAWLDKDILLQVTSRGKSIPVRHIARENSRVLRLGFGQEQPLEEAALVTVEIRDLRQKPIFATSYAAFVLKDAKLPALKNMRQTGSGSFLLEFDEPVYTGPRSSGFEFWRLNGHDIYARLVSVKPETAKSRLFGDFRRFAMLELNQGARSLYSPPGETNRLEGFGVADYAGQRSGKRLHNVRIKFRSPKPVEPVPQIHMQSPEQFVLRFPSETVSVYGFGLPLGADAIRFERQDGWDENGKPKWTTKHVRLNEDVALEYDGFTTYYLHMKKDWTDILQTKNGGPEYGAPGYDRVRITLLKGKAKDAGSTATNQTDIVREFRLPTDTRPPRIVKTEATYTAVSDRETLTVTFDEPVQIPGATRHLTPSNGESAVPSPAFEFVSRKTGKHIPAFVTGFLTARDDTTYTLTLPNEVALAPGRWELAVRNLSDDAGNQADILRRTIDIRPSLLLPHKHTEPPALAWGIAIDNVNADKTPEADEDVVVLQFNTILSADARARVHYWIAGQPLPPTAKVLARSVRFDSDNDGVLTDQDKTGTRMTLLLPRETFGILDDAIVAKPVEGIHFNVQVESEEGEDINKWGSSPYALSGTTDAILKEALSRYRKAEAAPSDYLWLNETIRHAEAELSASRAGDTEGEFPAEAIEALRQAVERAKQTATSKQAGRGETDGAIHSLQTAQAEFYTRQHGLPADKWNLIMELRIARSAWQEIKENPYQYPPGLSDTFAAAIAQAEAVLAKENASEQEVQNAYRRLVYAIIEKAQYEVPPPE
jgi:hypothetical protein